MRVLLTRPEAQSRALAESLAARGIDCLVDPLLDVAPMPGAVLDLEGVQAVLATSANGVRALADATPRRDVRVLAVGPATADACRDAGFLGVEAAGGDVAALAALAGERLDPARGRLVHVAGTAVAGDLSGDLKARGFTVERVVLYEARTAEALSPATAAALRYGKLDGVLLFSPRTAATFARLVGAAGLAATCSRLTAFCLSPAVAEALVPTENGANPSGGLAPMRVRVAQRPETDALLDLLLTEAKAMTDRQPEADAPRSGPAAASAAPSSAAPSASAPPTGAAPASSAAPASGAASASGAAASSPKPGPAKPGAKAPPAPPPGRSFRPLTLAAALALLVVFGGILYANRPDLFARFGIGGGGRGAALSDGTGAAGARDDDLAIRLRALEAAVDGVSQKTDSVGDVATQIGVLNEQSAAVEKRLAEFEQRLQAVEARLGEGGAPGAPAAAGEAAAGTLAALDKRLDSLEARAAGAASEETVANRLARQDERIGMLETAARGAGIDARETAAVFALGRLRTELDAGLPFGAALKSLDSLVRSGPLAADPPVRAALDRIAGRADGGVPTLADLRARFDAVARDALAAARRAPAEAGLGERLKSGLGNLVTVRRTGDVPGAEPDAIVARAERRLAVGDLGKAVDELASLEGAAAEAAAPWLDDARARLAAGESLVVLEGRMAAELGAGIDAPGTPAMPRLPAEAAPQKGAAP